MKLENAVVRSILAFYLKITFKKNVVNVTNNINFEYKNTSKENYTFAPTTERKLIAMCTR